MSVPIAGPTLPDYTFVPEKYPVLILSDVGTVIAAGIESMIYTGRIDLKSCGMAGLIGIVSRYIEKFIADQNSSQKFFSNDYREQKNQLIVFTITYLLTSRSKNALRYAFMTVHSDLLGKWRTDHCSVCEHQLGPSSGQRDQPITQ